VDGIHLKFIWFLEFDRHCPDLLKPLLDLLQVIVDETLSHRRLLIFTGQDLKKSVTINVLPWKKRRRQPR
jgi:hypothetical protein